MPTGESAFQLAKPSRSCSWNGGSVRKPPRVARCPPDGPSRRPVPTARPDESHITAPWGHPSTASDVFPVVPMTITGAVTARPDQADQRPSNERKRGGQTDS